MKLLADDRYAPLTSRVGFLEAPLDQVADALYQWMRAAHGLPNTDQSGRAAEVEQTVTNALELPPGLEELRRITIEPGARVDVEASRVMQSFPQVLLQLEPLSRVAHCKELLLETRSAWTAYFDNGARGGDPTTPVSYLCGMLRCRGLVAECVPNTISGSTRAASGRYGGVQFHLFSGQLDTAPLHYLRSISAVNDGGRWIFYAKGPVQPFEQPECYQARRVKDRFTAEMLEEYCAALGIQYFDPSFYGSNGVLIHVKYPGEDETGMSLAEAQQALGIPVSTAVRSS